MKVKRLSRTATLPQKAHAGDLGYDLFCDEATAIFPAETRVVKTGIAIRQYSQQKRELLKRESLFNFQKDMVDSLKTVLLLQQSVDSSPLQELLIMDTSVKFVSHYIMGQRA